jgi:hypothetical protein
LTDASHIAYCGLYCGDCIIRTREIGKKAGELLQVVKTDEFQKLCAGLPIIFPDPFGALSKIDDCSTVLGAMSQLDCPRPCKDGGGSADCLMKKCCLEKKIDGCWMCDSFENCRTLAWLEPVHGDAHLKNLRILRDQGVEAFLAGDKNW